MDKSILVLIIAENSPEKENNCIQLIENQTYNNLIIHTIKKEILIHEFTELIMKSNTDYIFFIRDFDRLSKDYLRTLVYLNDEKDADIIIGDYLEENIEGLYFPNRTFNQNELNLHSKEIEEYLEYQKGLDFLWDVLWGKLYKANLIKKAVNQIEKDNISLNDTFLTKYVYSLSEHIISHKNCFYIYKKKNISKDDYFRQRYVKIDYPLFYDNIKEALTENNIKVISFDIFDTLILRPFLYPTDIFIVLEQYVDTVIESIDGIGFKEIRVKAERILRDEKYRNKEQEVTLDEIYDKIREITSLSKEVLENIKRKETELEVEYCYVRQSGKELYELAEYLGKEIIFISDMYLPKTTIEKILHKNGYDKGKLFLSCEYNKTKAQKTLFKAVFAELQCRPSEIVHIGDNYVTDVEHAQSLGMKAFHLPRAEELFNNWNIHIYTGNYFASMFESQCGIVENYDAKELLGIRCLMALSANKMFDYPFVFYNKESDFNGNPYNIGYFALGMHLYAICRWIILGIQKNAYENLHFMARDAYIVKQAFEILKDIFELDINTYYTYISRKSLIPLMLQSKTDFINLVNCFNGYNISPKVFFNVISPVIKSNSEKELAKFCENIGIDFDKKIGSYDKFMKISKAVAENLFDQDKAFKFKKDFESCFASQFEGKSATFDMGYSARVESVLKSNFNYDVTANYIHTTLDRSYQRQIKKNIDINCFYDFTPFISGIARELIMSEMSGSCIGYSFKEGVAIPLLEKSEIESGTHYALYYMHRGALDFIRDMKTIFGKYNKKIRIRNYYASIPFDYYLTYSRPFDRSIFSMTAFEDDMGLGNDISFYNFWDNMITRMPVDSTGKLNYNRYGKLRRCLLMIVCGDLGELKYRFGSKLRNNKAMYGLAKSCYGFIRAIYRRLFKK